MNAARSTLHDTMQQYLVPQMYSPDNPRILNPEATLNYEGGSVKTVEIAKDLSVIVMAPEGTTPENAERFFLGMSGYMMPPTSIMGDKLTKPLMAGLMAKKAVAIFFAPNGRGSREPEQHQGRWTAERMRGDTSMNVRRVLEHFTVGERRIDVGAHSLAGQSMFRILSDRQRYGLNDRNFGGMAAWCPASPERSQSTWQSSDGRFGLNWPFIKLLPKAALPIIKSLLSGKGLMYGPEDGKQFFFDGQDFLGVEEVINRLFADSGLYFLQALTVGATGGELRSGSMENMPVGIMGASQDVIITDRCMLATREALERAGASLMDLSIQGGHFSPFLINSGKEIPEDVEVMRDKNTILLQHAMS